LVQGTGEIIEMSEEPRRGGGRRFDSGPREMFTITCSDCGCEAQVPFKPVDGRPVYCREYYEKHRPPRKDRF